MPPVKAPAYYAYERTPAGAIEQMEWQGTTQQAVDDMIANPSVDDNYWNSARITRAIIDSPLDGDPRIGLINDAVANASDVYAGRPDVQRMEQLRDRLGQYGLLGTVITQHRDERTMGATTPGRAKKSAELIAQETDGPLLMIPLCHGGFAAAIQVELAHRRLKPEADVAVYPVRYSRSKHNDTTPRISKKEMKYLKGVAEGRTVVVVDEDAITGSSIDSSIQHLAGKLPGNRIIGIANSDMRADDDREAQGQWWEKSANVPRPSLRQRLKNLFRR